MRKLYSLLLAISLIMATCIPARAMESTDPAPPLESETILPSEAEDVSAEVGTLEELQGAIDAAEDGDIIAISQTIYVYGETLSSDKDVTIVCAEGFSASNMVKIYSGSIVGLSFKGTAKSGLITTYIGADASVLIKDCTFDGMDTTAAVGIYGDTGSLAEINSCEFKDCYINAVHALAQTNLIMEDCYVHDTYGIDATGAVQSSGTLALINCDITRNTSFANAGVFSSGVLSIADCRIKENTITSPDKTAAVDVFCTGIWSITDMTHDGAGYYNTGTGEKVELPTSQNDSIAKLIYLSDEEAADYFAPEDDIGNPPPDPDDELPNNGEKPIQPPQEPEEPPEGEDSNDSQENEEIIPPETTEPPVEDNEENSTGDESNSSCQGGDGDAYEPVQPPVESDNKHDWVRPSKPTTPAPTPESDPEDDKPLLQCGDAVIDTSRSVALAGYSDGRLHEVDPLTRAQLATIIYRLLDDGSLELYGAGEAVFADVDLAAWYYNPVTTIGAAGIVSGIGGGNYNPSGLVTWAQVLTVMSRFVTAQEYKLRYIQYDGWARPSVETAVALGWIEDSTEIDPDAVITRGEAVDLINAILKQYQD